MHVDSVAPVTSHSILYAFKKKISRFYPWKYFFFKLEKNELILHTCKIKWNSVYHFCSLLNKEGNRSSVKKELSKSRNSLQCNEMKHWVQCMVFARGLLISIELPCIDIPRVTSVKSISQVSTDKSTLLSSNNIECREITSFERWSAMYNLIMLTWIALNAKMSISIQ